MKFIISEIPKKFMVFLALNLILLTACGSQLQLERDKTIQATATAFANSEHINKNILIPEGNFTKEILEKISNASPRIVWTNKVMVLNKEIKVGNSGTLVAVSYDKAQQIVTFVTAAHVIEGLKENFTLQLNGQVVEVVKPDYTITLFTERDLAFLEVKNIKLPNLGVVEYETNHLDTNLPVVIVGYPSPSFDGMNSKQFSEIIQLSSYGNLSNPKDVFDKLTLEKLGSYGQYFAIQTIAATDGNSGGGVFIFRNGKPILVAVVSSIANLEGNVAKPTILVSKIIPISALLPQP